MVTRYQQGRDFGAHRCPWALDRRIYGRTTRSGRHLLQERIKDRNQITDALSRSELQYAKGGKIISALGAPSRTLEEYIREGDAAPIDLEFNRAQSNVDTDPREAVSAASNILESICKVYIAVSYTH